MNIVFKPTCDLYDEYLDVARVPTVSFLNLGGERQFCGTVVTVKCFEDNSRIKELVAMEGKGKVMLVDGGGSQRCALVGDVLAGEAQHGGWAGIIVYGSVRDKVALSKLNLGVMALNVTPRKSVRRGEGQVDIPIQIGNIWCESGDIVYGDDDGILLLNGS
ncbi:MAG: ribonuclease activity regulator protein RraA [Gammaproteobacteria bacterium]|jgi:regulator of ribonuclease activity A|nr:ribonuclease activity regulator protein RraA [Gammaproteobacteria bacterium]MBD08491.1 ribonuclease activity regulator protein RraA [Gammaproteobacteria bacterium]MCH2669439.1 ribonuclease E activity regulator RraA [Gammaproteobacteria bacterium]|tara:strand:- start:483 stop:965 length:483 start_codon:yes stop_codon:yes gene_type:complete